MKSRYAVALPRSSAIALSIALAAAIPVTGAASPVDVTLLSAQYTTNLDVQDLLVPTGGGPSAVLYAENRNDTSPSPLASVLERHGNDVTARTSADADSFATAISTSAHGSATSDGMVYGVAHADSATILTFNAAQDATAPLVFSFLGTGYLSGGGYATLSDLTLSQALFHYDWYAGDAAQLALAQDVSLLAAHTYELTLYAYGDSSNDSTTTAIDVSGLSLIATATPEPSSLASALLGLGLVAFTVRRRRQAAIRA